MWGGRRRIEEPRFRLSGAVVAALLAWCPSLHVVAASPEETGGDELGIAVLDVRTTGDIDPVRMQPLSALVASETTTYRQFAVVTTADIREMLGLEAQRQLLSCDEDSSCLAEIGGSLGVPYLLVPEASFFGGQWLLTLTLLDVERSRPITRLTLRSGSDAELLDAIPAGVYQALKELVPNLEPSHQVVSSPGRARRPARPRTKLAWAAMAAGTVVAAGGGYLYGDARLMAGRHNDGAYDGSPLLTHQEASSLQLRSGVGLGMLAGGAAVLATGLFLPRAAPEQAGRGFAERRAREEAPRFLISTCPLPGGAMIALEVTRW